MPFADLDAPKGTFRYSGTYVYKCKEMDLNDSKLAGIAQQFGTPAYVFDEEALRQRVAFLQENLPARAVQIGRASCRERV